MFAWNIPLPIAKGVPEDQRKLIEHWHSKSGVDIPEILESVGQVLIPVRVSDGLVWDLLRNVKGV